jgi:hypothetical protein
MNLRLFHALERMAAIESSAMTTVRWPVDAQYEIVQTAEKDVRMTEYLRLFFGHYKGPEHLGELNEIIRDSEFERQQEAERLVFIESDVENPEQYDGPPDSVRIMPTAEFQRIYPAANGLQLRDTVMYNVGMSYVRSDPYTGMSMLYTYLYCGGMRHHTSHLVLHFPNISRTLWDAAAAKGNRKDVRLYLAVADGIIFENVYVPIAQLRPAGAQPLELVMR